MHPVYAFYIYRHEPDHTSSLRKCTIGTSGKSLDTAASPSRCHTALGCNWFAVLSKALLMASIISYTCSSGSIRYSNGLPASTFNLKFGKTTSCFHQVHP